MTKWDNIIAFLCFSYNLSSRVVCGATYQTNGMRVSDACKGFISLNNTINCASCSSMCHVLLQSQNELDPECIAVQVDSSNTQCTQAKAENGQILCFDTKIRSEDQVTIVDADRVDSMKTYPYIGGLTDEDLVKYVPVVQTDPPLPEYTHPTSPFEKWGFAPSVLFNHGLFTCRERFGACAHWPFRSNTWTPMPKPLVLRHGSGLGIWNGRPIAPGGFGSAYRAIDSVEYYDPNQQKWVTGPKLTPPRGFHTIVQVDESTMIVIGGKDEAPVTYTDLLSAGDSQWVKLEGRPKAVFDSICGVVELGDKGRGILSMAGYTDSVKIKQSYFLAFESMTWTPVPDLDAPYATYVGSVIQWDSWIYFIPHYGTISMDAKPYMKNVEELNLSWKTSSKLFPGLGPTSQLKILNVIVLNTTTT
ncbi:uncharacterized protein LOC131891778 [Tigriopus californicus]|uniref:uncharacterized protein LOC131891778 n=1 Tax=Tigriopus californicus TaxID=6832 RepID=UPI0027D9D5FA|nr:uncharacterized protein LOC131891778 [Tigriopus californicus]